jgi:hypothetical protein
MMEAIRPSESSVYFYKTPHGAVSQKAIILILSAERTWNLTTKYEIFKLILSRLCKVLSNKNVSKILNMLTSNLNVDYLFSC